MQILPTISMPIVGGPVTVFVGPRALMIPASTCGPDPQRRLVSAIGMGASEIPAVMAGLSVVERQAERLADVYIQVPADACCRRIGDAGHFRASGSRKFAEQLAPVVGRACEGTQHSLKGADRAWNSHSSRKNVLSKSAAGKTQAPIFAAVLNVNILHLIVISSAGVTILPLLREARGRSLPPSRLFGAVPFALATATLLLAMGAPETREPCLWLAGLLVGTVLGAVRGSFLRFQLDRMYSRLRLPKGRDGLWAACMLAFCTLVSFGATLASLPDSALEVGATSAVAACAGYLTGRAAALWRRSLSAPHQNLHHFPP